jgi:hypothetical protein
MADGIERPHEADTGKELGRGDAGAFAARLYRHVAVAFRIRVSSIEHDLAFELVLQD